MPFAPTFYKLDFSELPVMIITFAFGPVAGILTEFIKILLKVMFRSTTTAFVGELANFCVGASLILPSSIIYNKNQFYIHRKALLLYQFYSNRAFLYLSQSVTLFQASFLSNPSFQKAIPATLSFSNNFNFAARDFSSSSQILILSFPSFHSA